MKRLTKHSTLLCLLFICFHLSTLPGVAQPIITTYAGGLLPINGAQATTQDINKPRSVVSDGAGGFYFASEDQRVYRVTASGVLTVIAGNGTTVYGGDDGLATAAPLLNPTSIAVDAAGNIFIADNGNNRIRKVAPNGVITTVAGNGTSGFSGDGGSAISARLYSPIGVAVDDAGNLFIADNGNNRIRKVTSAGIISTVAGNGLYGFSGDGGLAVSARLAPVSVVVDTVGNLFIADPGASRIRKVTPAGIISTVAGNGTPGSSGDGGPAVSAQLAYPRNVALDTAGNLYISDSNSNRIRKVNSAGIISTVAGGTFGFAGDGGLATFAGLSSASGIAVDAAGNMFIADSGNRRIRKVTSAGIISTVAGSGSQTFSGDGGPATSARLYDPGGVAVDKAGNVFIADSSNHRIRKVTPAGIISTFAGSGSFGYSGDGGPAISAQLSYPASVVVDAAGNVFIADSSNHIRKVSPDGVITSLANITTGDFCPAFFDDYSEGYSVTPALTVDAAGNLFVADSMNNRIRKVTPAGVISTVAGNGSYDFSGDGGPAVSAQLFCPGGVAVDASGNIFISDFANSRVRKVNPDGIIVTLAGTGEWGNSGDGGPASSARLGYPSSVAVDPQGNVFILDPENYLIRELSPAGIISTVAGTGISGFSGDGGPAASAQLNYAGGIAVDASGNLYIADTYNQRIRKVGLALTVPTVTGVFPDVGSPGTTVNLTLAGTSFVSPLSIDVGSGVTVSNISVVSQILATATLTIASDAELGARNLTVSTALGTSTAAPFTVVAPFPDLTIASAHVGNLAAGFNGVYAVRVVNVGLAPTTGDLTVTDNLPIGLTFISGTGNGWSCSAVGQKVTCVNSGSLEPGASTTITLTLALSGSVASYVVHAPAVAVAGDLISANDTASDAANVAVLTARLQFESLLVAGRQSSVRLTLPVAFPYDVSGTLVLAYAPDAAIPADDPAIQFASGGREVSFTIPANTQEARFGDNPQAGPIGFQPGTVAGVLSFIGTLQAGEAQSTFSTVQSIPRQVPSILTVRTDTKDGSGVVITLLSTMREVKELILGFATRQSVHLSCGSVAGCSVSGTSMKFDVKSLFDGWYAGDSTFGSVSTIRLPFSMQGTITGNVLVTFRNSLGTSNLMSFPLPVTGGTTP